MVTNKVSSVNAPLMEFCLAGRANDGLSLLLYAYFSAHDAGRLVGDFALTMHELHEVGMKRSDLRWLVGKGYAAHLLDTTLPGETGRAIRPIETLHFVKASCFALTQAGVVFAERLSQSAQRIQVEVAVPPATASQPAANPIWDSNLRQLQFRETVIKRFRIPAPNQELILCAFEEEGWPDRIDDPLRPKTGVPPIKRLSKSIYRLNKSLDPPLIHFSCDVASSVFWKVTVRQQTRAFEGRKNH